MDTVILTGSLRLLAGLGFLGVVMALCLWLLNRLFPGVSQNSQNNTASGIAQRHRLHNVDEMKRYRDDRADDRHTN
jgi:hypothetical protein